MDRFELSESDVFELQGLLDYPDLFQISGLDVPGLRDPHWVPKRPARLAGDPADQPERSASGLGNAA